MKKFELLTATALAMTVATPAWAAQDQTANTSPTSAAGTADPARAQPSSAAPAATEEYENANEVVVTATRRADTIQNVPIAITALGAQQLADAGVTDIKDLEQIAPSVQTSTGQSSATGSTIYIRGITTAGDNPGFEPAVGVFIDGVFRARAGVAVAELPELERVEILRGPQGTLFGRNTSAGALSVFTAKPKSEFGGYAEGSYGNYNAYSLKGAINAPVGETLALRVDGGYRKRDGYIKDVNSSRRINNIDRWNLRGQALLDTGDLTVRLIADYYKTDEQCCGSVSVVRGSLTPVVQGIAALQGRTGIYTGAPSDRMEAISPNRDFGERVRDYGLSAEINYDLGATKLTSITAYRNWRALRSQDIDFSGIDRAYRDGYRSNLKDFTQELRLQGSALNGVLDWLVGGFFLHEDNTLRDTVRFGNDANRYVDFALNGATRSASLPSGAQFYGSFGVPTLQQLGAAFQGLAPLPTGAVPLFGQVLYLQNPLVAPNVRLQQIATPGSALFNLLNSPLPGAVAGQGNNDDNFQVKTNAFAAFTHNIIKVTDQVSITLGARWNHETKRLNSTIANNTGSCAFFNQLRAGDPAATTYAALLKAAAPNNALFNNLFLLSCNPAVNTEFNGNYQNKFSENKLTGTAKLSFKVSPRLMLYGSYDRGYKSGGYNLDQGSFDSVILGGNGPQGSDLRFGSESVNAYELGFKSSVSRQFTLNFAGFYQRFKGLQSLVFSGNNFVVQNVPKSISKGVEVEANVRPANDLIFQLGYSYIQAEYDKSNNFTGTPLAGQEGQQFNNQPKHTVTIGGSWTPALSQNWRGLVHMDMRYNSEVNIPSGSPNAFTGRTALFNQGYPLVAARIGIQSADRTKSLEFWVENLTNKYYHITGFGVPEQTGNFNAYPGYPRFYGVTGRLGF